MISVLAPLPSFLHPPYVISSPSPCPYRETLWSFSTSNLPNPTISLHPFPSPSSRRRRAGASTSQRHALFRTRCFCFPPQRGGRESVDLVAEATEPEVVQVFVPLATGGQERKAEDGRSRGGKGEETLPRDSCKKRRLNIYCKYVACFFSRISQYIHPVLYGHTVK